MDAWALIPLADHFLSPGAPFSMHRRNVVFMFISMLDPKVAGRTFVLLFGFHLLSPLPNTQ